MEEIYNVIISGFTYNENLQHSIINYIILAVVILPFVLEKPGSAKSRKWITMLVAAFIVQALLWFGLGASGISVIWCAAAGYMIMELLRNNRSMFRLKKRTVAFALFTVLAGIVYYGITFPVITTIAHIAGLILGIVIYFILNLSGKKNC